MKRPGSKAANADAVASILRDYLARRTMLHLEGVGVLRAGKNGGFEFEPEAGPRVFIGYASEDLGHARRLSRQLRASGLRPWLDQEQLLPGQDWPRAIDRAIESADFAIQCFSPNSVARRGYFYKELRHVLECASRVPFDEVFLLPVRFAECSVPERVATQFQYVDLFPDWSKGVGAIVDVMLKQHVQRRQPL